jgi:hypothetical protein
MADITVAWDAPVDGAGVTGYDVYYGLASHDGVSRPGNPGVDPSPYDAVQAVADPGTLTATIPGLAPGTAYYFRVASRGATPDISSDFSNEVAEMPSIEAPSNLRVV